MKKKQRLVNRFECPRCGFAFHVPFDWKPLRLPDCDKCGAQTKKIPELILVGYTDEERAKLSRAIQEANGMGYQRIV